MAPRPNRFGEVLLSDEAPYRGFLDGAQFVFTGTERWNALGLGTTAVFATSLVCNTKRSGRFSVGGREFLLRRVASAETPSPEWFAVDIFENAEQTAVAPEDLAGALEAALRERRFDRAPLASMSMRYGSRRTQLQVRKAFEATVR